MMDNRGISLQTVAKDRVMITAVVDYKNDWKMSVIPFVSVNCQTRKIPLLDRQNLFNKRRLTNERRLKSSSKPSR